MNKLLRYLNRFNPFTVMCLSICFDSGCQKSEGKGRSRKIIKIREANNQVSGLMQSEHSFMLKRESMMRYVLLFGFKCGARANCRMVQ